MRRIAPPLALLALAACADSGPPTAAAPEQPARGRYIVVLDPGALRGPSLSIAVDRVARDADADPRFVYTTVLQGFAAELDAAQLAALRADPRVRYVERDAEVILFTTQTGATWGLDRIDQADLPLSTTYSYTATGAGVTAYVLDTGIRRSHADFGGRADYIPSASNGDFVGDGHGSAEDCHGHGTHVAGTIGSTTYGVAKGVTLRSGRVVNCSGGGSVSMVIAGMDWVAANGTRPATVNMSLGYGNVQSVRDAAERLVAAGYVVAVAAGNGNFAGIPQDACSGAPGGAPNVLTVGATTSSDAESSFSNYGTCVDILAPGSSITSLGISSNTATATMSGTSMATPHVAGVASLYLSLNPSATPATAMTAIKAAGTLNTITLHRRSRQNGTPNRFLRTSY